LRQSSILVAKGAGDFPEKPIKKAHKLRQVLQFHFARKCCISATKSAGAGGTVFKGIEPPPR
jgi:hypothetical protein